MASRGESKNPQAVEENLPGAGTVQAEQNVHQGRLSGPVLSQDGNNLSAPQRNGDVLVGNHASKYFCHPTGFEEGRMRRQVISGGRRSHILALRYWFGHGA